LDDATDCRDFLGQIEGVAYQPVNAQNLEPSYLGHYAERAAQLNDHNRCTRISDKHEKRRRAGGHVRKLAVRKKNDRGDQEAAEQRRQARSDPASSRFLDGVV